MAKILIAEDDSLVAEALKRIVARICTVDEAVIMAEGLKLDLPVLAAKEGLGSHIAAWMSHSPPGFSVQQAMRDMQARQKPTAMAAS